MGLYVNDRDLGKIPFESATGEGHSRVRCIECRLRYPLRGYRHPHSRSGSYKAFHLLEQMEIKTVVNSMHLENMHQASHS